MKRFDGRTVVITGASGDAGPVQLHVTTKTANGMEMKQTSNFTLAPGGTLKLAPGGNHLMFMNLSKALAAGDEPAPWFEVSLIPTTLELTTLGRAAVGAVVNLEVDVVAKYVERLVRTAPKEDA
mgnify:CR=1 FL=1